MSNDEIKYMNPMVKSKGGQDEEEVSSYKINGNVFPCSDFEVEIIVRQKPKLLRFAVGTVLQSVKSPCWLYTRRADGWYAWFSDLNSLNLWHKVLDTDSIFQEFLKNGRVKFLYSPVSGQ